MIKKKSGKCFLDSPLILIERKKWKEAANEMLSLLYRFTMDYDRPSPAKLSIDSVKQQEKRERIKAFFEGKVGTGTAAQVVKGLFPSHGYPVHLIEIEHHPRDSRFNH